METYKVAILRVAKQDLAEIVDYLNTLSRDAALAQYDRIVDAVATTLREFPLRCPQVKDRLLRAKGYRVLVVENYLVFYVVLDSVVQIRRILYGKRNYEWLL